MSDTSFDSSQTTEASFGDYFALLKPRVMSLVVFTALVGLLVAPGSVHPIEGFAAILFIALGGGASGALNMWYDADIDRIMKRTQKRPIPAGKVTRDEAFAIGIALSCLSVIMLGLASNLVAAGLLAFTIFFYVVIYTMWLKRSTPQNIVIGGAAGAFPPMIGWAVSTGDISIESIMMFAITFFWTPPHFWALALFMKSDYSDAKVPMLTVTHGRRNTRIQIFAYTVLLAALSVGMSFTALNGPVFLATAVILNLLFIKGAWTILRRNEEQAEGDNYAAERSFFKLSLLYLFLLFTAILADAVLVRMGIGLGGLGMSNFRPDHELHQRRRGRNFGLLAVLIGFVALVFLLTVVKVQNGGKVEAFDHTARPSLTTPEGGQ